MKTSTAPSSSRSYAPQTKVKDELLISFSDSDIFVPVGINYVTRGSNNMTGITHTSVYIANNHSVISAWFNEIYKLVKMLQERLKCMQCNVM